MALFNKRNHTNAFTDEIRCDESSYLIWKWHPAGSRLGASRRENAIRFGSSLRVKDGSVAVFVYDQDDGVHQELIEGPCDIILDTLNLPVLASIVGAVYGGGTPFQAEVFFVNLAEIVQIRFAVPYFDVFDARFPDFGVPVAVRGTLTFKIEDYRAFIRLHRLDNFDLQDFKSQVKAAISRYVKQVAINAASDYGIPVFQLECRIADINAAIASVVCRRLANDFGVQVSGVDIDAIEIDKTSEGYASLKAVTQDVASAEVQARTAASIRDIHDRQRIEAENYEDTLRIQREEEQYAQRMHTRTSNFGAYQVEKQAEVGVAGAQALGQMGANGASDANIGGGGDGTGFNMAAMMASMAVGSAVGQNIAGAMNNMMGGINQQTTPGAVPPPIPTVAYHVAVNEQATGPFDISVLAQMTTEGRLTVDSLVWKNGMTQWEKAGKVDELKNLFANVMPPIPPQG